MNYVKGLAALGVAAMTAALIYGFTVGDFRADGEQLLNNPWGIVSLVDLYTGFSLFAGWAIYREKSLPLALAWTAAFMVLGFLAASLYVLLAAMRSEGDWMRFWMGRRAGSGENA